MSFKWKHQCFQCGRPIYVYFDSDFDDDVLTKSILFFVKRPISLEYNKMYYKFYGLKVKRVCRSCFENKIMYNPKVHRDRELGIPVKFMYKSYTKTKEQIENWNTKLDDYLKNRV